MRNVQVPIYKIGQNIGGLVITAETLSTIIDRFIGVQKNFGIHDSDA